MRTDQHHAEPAQSDPPAGQYSPFIDSKFKKWRGHRVKTPTMLQMEVTECGAAALGIVLGYHGLNIPLEKLREECGVSRDGSKAINMLKAARRYGMIAQGAKIEELHDLVELKLPVIAFWEFNHFVVLEGVKPGKFYINDPATGPRVLPEEDFNRAFTGVILTFIPGPDFQRGGRRMSAFHIFRERLRGSMLPLIYIFLGSLALVIPGILIPGFSKIFIDDILIRGTANWLHILIVAMIVAGLMRGLIIWLQQKSLLQLHLKLMLINSAKFLWHVLHLPVVFFQQRYVGDLETRVAANDRIAQLLSSQISSNAVNVISMVFYGAIMFLFSWQLSTLVTSVVFINMTLFYTLSRRITDSSRQFLQQQGRLNGIEVSGLFTMESMKASSAEDVFFYHWASEHAQTINSQQRIMRYTLMLDIIPNFLDGMLNIIVLGWGAWLIMQGQLTIGTLVAFQILVGSFVGPISALLGFAQETQEIRGDLMRLYDVFNYPSEYVVQKEHQPVDEPLPSTIKMTHLVFGYSKLEEPLIIDFNLNMQPGQRIALVGATGSGKSTVIRLVCRLYQPWSGTIEIGGQALRNIATKQLSKTIALVDQDIFLFGGTVRDNLTLWNPDIEDEILYQALQDACMYDVVVARGGLESRVSEGGLNFSGGQRQRLEIARALAYQPSILILDEATSSLDPAIELEVYENIKKRGYSVLLVAHRLSAIRDCDEIIVLDQGRVVQRGRHEQLIQLPGQYQQLLQVGE